MNLSLEEYPEEYNLPSNQDIFEKWRQEAIEQKKKIANALKVSKKIVSPKRLFYNSSISDPGYNEELFYVPHKEPFYCPHCNEEYDPGDYYYEDRPLPSECLNCGKRMDIHQIIRAYGDWAVTLYGIENLTCDYNIFRTRVYDKSLNWIKHMCEKPWVNLNDFARAFEFAKLFFGSLLPPKAIPIKEKKVARVKKQTIKKLTYKEYLQTDHWKQVKTKALKYYGDSCVLCSSTYRLNVHHRNYDHLWKERIKKDLIVLCQNCHAKFHGIIE